MRQGKTARVIKEVKDYISAFPDNKVAVIVDNDYMAERLRVLYPELHVEVIRSSLIMSINDNKQKGITANALENIKGGETMSSIGKYMKPLWIFGCSQVSILFLFLFFPYIETKLVALLAATPAMAAWWGWTWVVSSARLYIVVVAELVSLWVTARSFMEVRENG